MAPAQDKQKDPAPPEVTAKDIAWCAGAKAPWRHNWAKEGRLKAEPPFTRHDAVETAIAAHLVATGGGKKATQAWDTIRPTLRQLVLADDDIWLVIGADGYRHAAVVGAAAAAESAHELGVPCWVIPTADVADEAKQRYAELRKDGGEQAAVTELRRGGQSG